MRGTFVAIKSKLLSICCILFHYINTTEESYNCRVEIKKIKILCDLRDI